MSFLPLLGIKWYSLEPHLYKEETANLEHTWRTLCCSLHAFLSDNFCVGVCLLSTHHILSRATTVSTETRDTYGHNSNHTSHVCSIFFPLTDSHRVQQKDRGKKDLCQSFFFFPIRKSIHGVKRTDQVDAAEKIGVEFRVCWMLVPHCISQTAFLLPFQIFFTFLHSSRKQHKINQYVQHRRLPWALERPHGSPYGEVLQQPQHLTGLRITPVAFMSSKDNFSERAKWCSGWQSLMQHLVFSAGSLAVNTMFMSALWREELRVPLFLSLI